MAAYIQAHYYLMVDLRDNVRNLESWQVSTGMHVLSRLDDYFSSNIPQA